MNAVLFGLFCKISAVNRLHTYMMCPWVVFELLLVAWWCNGLDIIFATFVLRVRVPVMTLLGYF